MKTNNITPEQERIFDNIHNLIWYRITHDEKYLQAIPEIESPDFHEWIYFITYRFIEYDDSTVDAIVYLNGKHYQYYYQPQFLSIIYVDEIEESKVKDKIIEIGGEIYEGFEIYDPNAPVDNDFFNEQDNGMAKKEATEDDEGYEDLPF